MSDDSEVWADGIGRSVYGNEWPGDLASGPSDLLPLLQMDGAVMCAGSHRGGLPRRSGSGYVPCLRVDVGC